MITSFAIYDTLTGEILRTGRTSGSLADQTQAGESVAQGIFDDTTTYIQGGLPADRPLNTVTQDKAVLALGELLTLSQIPAGQTLTVIGPDGLFADLPEGEETLTFQTAGAYRLFVRGFPYQEKILEVVVNDA